HPEGALATEGSRLSQNIGWLGTSPASPQRLRTQDSSTGGSQGSSPATHAFVVGCMFCRRAGVCAAIKFCCRQVNAPRVFCRVEFLEVLPLPGRVTSDPPGGRVKIEFVAWQPCAVSLRMEMP